MSEIKQTFNSSLGKKLIMALTGLFLCTFLIVHLGGNLLLFSDDLPCERIAWMNRGRAADLTTAQSEASGHLRI